MRTMVTGDQSDSEPELTIADEVAHRAANAPRATAHGGGGGGGARDGLTGGTVHIRLKGGDAGTADGPGSPGFVEVEPVTCSCKWATMDTGNSFYSRIVKADPKCRVHPPGRGW